MIIPLRSDKAIDVMFNGLNINTGMNFRVKIIAIGYLKDCHDDCWTCTTTSRLQCTSCRINLYLYSNTNICVSDCSAASS